MCFGTSFLTQKFPVIWQNNALKKGVLLHRFNETFGGPQTFSSGRRGVKFTPRELYL